MNRRPSSALRREQFRPFSETKFFKHGKVEWKWRFCRCRAGDFLWQEVFVLDPAGLQLPSSSAEKWDQGINFQQEAVNSRLTLKGVR